METTNQNGPSFQRQAFPPVEENFQEMVNEAAALTYRYALPLAAQAFVLAFVRLREKVARQSDIKDVRIHALEQRVAALEKRIK